MVRDALKASAREPDGFKDRVCFLLGLAERLRNGEPMLQALEHLQRGTETEPVRGFIEGLRTAIVERSSLGKVVERCADVFPPMVASLVDLGERLGELDVTLRMAGEWLRKGEYRVNPHAFADASLYPLRSCMRQGISQGADHLVMDTRGDAAGFHIEMEMPDGKRSEALRLHPKYGIRRWAVELKMLTILDKRQKGDVLTGRLRVRLNPQDEQEALLPITYRPYCQGGLVFEEIRINLSRESGDRA